MPLDKHITHAYLFPNGNLAAFDKLGQQVGYVQGAYSIEKHKRILLEATDRCEFKGFEILPYGFICHADDWAKYFRGRDKSWEEIQNL